MALSAIAPTEKGEHFIYASFPISLSLLIAALVTTDPAGWLTIVSIISPLGTILLYELGLDERFVKWYYSNKVRAKSRDLKDFILASNIILESWNSLLQNPPQVERDWYLEKEAGLFIKQAISSFPVRRRLWRIRGTIYLGLSIVVLVPTGLMLSIDYLNVVLNQTEFFIFWIASTLILNYLIIVSNRIRHSNIVEHMVDLVQYFYMQVLIAEDSARNPGKYANQDSTRYVMKSESASLDIVLFRGDWSVFHQRWSRFCRTILNLARRDFEGNFENIAFEKWALFIRNSKRQRYVETSRREFSWFVVISNWARGLLHAGQWDLIDFLSSKAEEDTQLKELQDASLVLSFLPSVFMNDTEEEEKSRTSAVGIFLSLLLTNSTRSFEQAVRLIIDNLMKDEDIGIPPENLARIVMQYAKETHNMNGKHAFPNNPDIGGLRGVMKYLMNESDVIYVVVSFLQVADKNGFHSLVEDDDIRTLLFEDPAWDFVQEKANVLGVETQLMKRLEIQRKKYLLEI